MFLENWQRELVANGECRPNFAIDVRSGNGGISGHYGRKLEAHSSAVAVLHLEKWFFHPCRQRLDLLDRLVERFLSDDER